MTKRDIFYGLMIALFLAIVVSPFASPWPDGLEKVAQSKGFMDKEREHPLILSPFSDYLWPNLDNEKIATALAGGVGALFVFIAGYGMGMLIKLLKRK
ncbi:MAG: hypothetical protein DRO14_03395 [Thermoprotei archaeon]|nr:MAG: hypothetical protein DRO14_03395 [Thermoprotei archaeon]